MLKDETITWFLLLLVVVCFSIYFAVLNGWMDRESWTEASDQIAHYAQDGEWTQATTANIYLQQRWKREKHWVSLNNAEQDYSEFSKMMAVLDGAVASRDQAIVIETTRQLDTYWRNFKKIVPEP